MFYDSDNYSSFGYHPTFNSAYHVYIILYIEDSVPIFPKWNPGDYEIIMKVLSFICKKRRNCKVSGTLKIQRILHYPPGKRVERTIPLGLCS